MVGLAVGDLGDTGALRLGLAGDGLGADGHGAGRRRGPRRAPHRRPT